MAETLGCQGIYGRQVLSTETLTILSSLVQECTISIMALFVAEEGGAVLSRSKLRSINAAVSFDIHERKPNNLKKSRTLAHGHH